MNTPSLFDQTPPEPDPKDAPPAATGGSVKHENTQRDRIRPRRKSRMQHTSIEAYHALGSKAKTVGARILKLIIEAGEYGLTDDEGEKATSLLVQTYTGARNRLMKAGLVRKSGRFRRTTSGCRAIVWIASTLGGMAPTDPGTAPTTARGASSAKARREGGGA
jgi:hypothetical protein